VRRAGAGTAARVVHMGAVSSLLAVLLVSMWGCGAGQNSSQPPPLKITLNNIGAYYSLSSQLNLTYAIAGQDAFTLLASGSGFTTSSVIEWNGTALPTSFGDSSDLGAAVSASLIATPGTVTVTVRDTSSGSISNVVPFGIASSAAATAGVVQLITVATDGTSANADSLVAPSINSDGRYVAFQSAATNVVAGPASGYQDIYLRDTCLGSAPPGCTPSTTRISVTYDGSPTNFHSFDSSVSSDGRFVAFDSEATNILPNTSICNNTCAFLRDTCNGAPAGCVPTTTLVSVTQDGTAAGGANPSMSGDEFIAFNANGTYIGATGGVGEAFVRDTCFGAATSCAPGTTLVSVSSSGDPGNERSGLPVISATGRYIAFQSWGTNLAQNVTTVPGDYWRDTCIGAPAPCAPSTVRADVTASGAQPNNSVPNNVVPAISSDGRLVAFGSGATNLVSLNVGSVGNAYVRDTCTGAPPGCTPTTSVVSLANDGSVANCGSPSQGISISAAGRFVAFDSIATNLVPGGTFPACAFEDIFVRDTCYGVPSGCTPSTVRASVTSTPSPETQANAISGYPAISGDGHYVVFLSASTNLIPGGTNGHNMVFLAKTGF
jgi:hypothetical protein